MYGNFPIALQGCGVATPGVKRLLFTIMKQWIRWPTVVVLK